MLKDCYERVTYLSGKAQLRKERCFYYIYNVLNFLSEYTGVIYTSFCKKVCNLNKKMASAGRKGRTND